MRDALDRVAEQAVPKWPTLKPLVRDALLAVLDAYPDYIVLRRRVLFVRLTIRARDVRAWVVWLFGGGDHDPAAAA